MPPRTSLVSTTGRPISPDSRAIVLAQILEMGGAERSCMALSRWLHQHNIPNHFVTYSDAANLPSLAAHPLDLVELRPPMRAISKILSLRQHFRALRSPFVPLMSGYQPALHATLAQLPRFHTLMHDTPSLFSDKGLPTQPHRRALRALSDSITARGLRRGGTTMVTSEYLRDETCRVFGITPAIVRMGGLGSPADFRPRPAGPQLNLFSVSRVESNKRIDWMLRSLATLESEPTPLSSTVDWHLHVAGTGSLLEPMRQLAASLGLAARTHFHGFVSDDQLATLYNQADLFLMPAIQGYGIPAIESLQRGIPVLLHRDSGVSDILRSTPWAFVFSGGEPEMIPALQNAIHSVRNNRQLTTPLPTLPTEDTWAEEVATRCGWL